MALRPEPSGGPQAIAGLPTCWRDASKNPTLEWEKWRDLFEVALMAKNNISISELTKTGNKDKSLMGDLDEVPATKKAISVLYLALGSAGRKSIADKFPTTNIATVSLQILVPKTERRRIVEKLLERIKWISSKMQLWRDNRQFSKRCLHSEHDKPRCTTKIVH